MVKFLTFLDSKKMKEFAEYYKTIEKTRQISVGNETGKQWFYFDSSLRQLNDSFSSILPDNCYYLYDYLEKIFENKKGKLIFVEMGGPAIQLNEDMAPLLERSAGLTLQVGINNQKVIDKIKNLPKNHKIIIGDMFLYKTEKKLKDWLNEGENNKIDILFERMIFGLNSIPPEGVWCFRKINKWWKLLNEGGVMFIENPQLLGNDYDVYRKWIEKMEKEKGLEIQISENKKNILTTGAVHSFRLRKLKNYPEDLPMVTKEENPFIFFQY